MVQHKEKIKPAKATGKKKYSYSAKASPVKIESEPTVLCADVAVSKEELKYLKRIGKKINEDDPTLVIGWQDDIVDETVLAAVGNVIPGVAPPVPAFLNMTSTGNFKTSIHNYLRQVSGGSFGCVLGPNNSEQFDHVLTRLRDIEMMPYMQYLGRFAGVPLAITARIKDKGIADPQPRNALAPAAPAVQIFA